MRYVFAAIAALLLIAPGSAPAEEGKDKSDEGTLVLFDGKSLDGWKSTNYGGEGEVEVKDGQLVLNMGEPLTGVTYQKGDKLPKDHYEISLEAMKLEGDDFFVGLTFPIRDSHASFIVGGWAGGVVGISSIDNLDASENETTKYETFDKNKWYKIKVRVDGNSLKAWIDGKEFVDVDLKDRKVDTRIEVDISKPLGLAAFRTKAAYRNLKIKKLAEK
jgi:hypothetical protein